MYLEFTTKAVLTFIKIFYELLLSILDDEKSCIILIQTYIFQQLCM